MRDIIGGFIAGIILGLIQLFLFDGNWLNVIIATLMGTFIGWFHKDLNHGFFVGCGGIIGLSVVIGALFFIIVAASSGTWSHTILAGAITGGLIGILMKLAFPRRDN